MPDTDTHSDQGCSTGESERLLSVGDVAKLAGVSVSTVQRWDRSGVCTARRTPNNRRRYLYADVEPILRQLGRLTEDEEAAA